MAEPYKDVRLVLGDPDPAFGKTVSSAVFPLGLRDISVCIDGERLRDATAATVDVVACDTSLPKLDFRSFAQDVRHGKVGQNPFVILIATVLDEAAAKAEHIPECGIDEMIAKPVNPLLLVRRIGMLAKDRKPFVLTPGYVGPSRRAARRNDGSDDAVVAVPNTLRARVVEQKSDGAVDGLVVAGRTTLNQGIAASGVNVIARLVRQLGERQSEGAGIEEFRRLLGALARMASQVASEHRDSGSSRNIPPIAERMRRLASRAEAAPARPPQAELDLLARLSDAANVALADGTGAADAVPEIVAVVDSYLARS